MTHTAAGYLEEISATLDRGYPADCVTHACRLAELLLVEGKRPWVARLRDVQHTEAGVFHGPLTPRRLLGKKGPTWTTHYVTCEGELVYDPLTEAPVPLGEYAVQVFGREIPMESFLGADETARLCRANELRVAFRPKHSSRNG